MDFSTKPSFNQCCPDCQNNKRLFKKIQDKFQELFIDFNILFHQIRRDGDDSCNEEDGQGTMD